MLATRRFSPHFSQVHTGSGCTPDAFAAYAPGFGFFEESDETVFGFFKEVLDFVCGFEDFGVDFVSAQEVFFAGEPDEFVVAAPAGGVLMLDLLDFDKRVAVAEFLDHDHVGFPCEDAHELACVLSEFDFVVERRENGDAASVVLPRSRLRRCLAKGARRQWPCLRRRILRR